MPTRTIPRYRKIADGLIEVITSGRYALGTNLPPESELCAQLGASRHTVREALRIVEEAGLIARRQGSGSEVISNTAASRYRQTLDSIEDLMQHGAASRLQLLSTARAPVPAALARVLGCAPGAACVTLRCLRSARHAAAGGTAGAAAAPREAGAPFALMQVWFPPRNAALTARLLNPAQALSALVRHLVASRIGRIEQTLSAVALDATAARALGVDKAAPALRAERTYFDHQGGLMLHAESLHRADVYRHSSVLRHVGS